MKLLRKIGFFSAFIIPGLVVMGFYLGGAWNLSALLFSFIFIPVIDFVVGLDTTNVSGTEKEMTGEEFYYRFVTYVWVYVQFAFLLWAIFEVSLGSLHGTIEWVGFVIGCGLVTGGIGITVAHELGHKKSRLEQFYSKALLMTVCYMHFFIEHNRGHHVHVATPEDPATAHKKQNVYSFWVQSVIGSFVHAWSIESESLHRKNKQVVSMSNAMVVYILLPIVFCAALTWFFSLDQERIQWQIPIFFFLQSLVAFSLLELINYIEHYGISRKEISPGQYERVNPLHSWNASHRVSNFFLFQLQRHSDHHANAIKRYQVLDHFDESPQLPYGYPTMILTALIPPIWFRIMEPRLAVWEEARKSSLGKTHGSIHI